MTATTPPPLPAQFVQIVGGPRAMQDRPGVQTSEFWLAIVATIAINYQSVAAPGASLEDRLAQLVALIGTAMVSMGYTKARSGIKASAAERQSAQEGQQ